MKDTIKKILGLIKHQKFKEVLIIYILINLGILCTVYGSILYSPSLIPDTEEMSLEGARMELMNLSKGALIAQNFEINQYNIGFDMLNIGGIFLIIGLLFYNSVESSMIKKNKKKPALKVYKLYKKGRLQGNILEWLCLIVFLFSFFTFFYNVFVYVIIVSFIVGVIGFTIRKLNNVDLFSTPNKV